MSKLNGRRIGRLEADAPRGASSSACQACGLLPGERPPIEVLYPAADDAPPEPPRRCAGCGRDTELYLRVVYEGAEGGGGKL